MVSLSTSGNSIIFTFENSQHYLYGNGQVECPKNSLILVTDSSEMATFKKAASNDIFISATYSELGMTKSELISYYEDNMVGSTGGGSGSSITSGEVQTMIDTSISGKADTSAVTEEISAATSGLQQSLSAGTGIDITDNVISVTGGSSQISSAITSGDTNPVEGGAIYDKFDEVEQVTAMALNDLNSRFSGYVETSAITTSVTSASTDSEIPTAKAVYDAIPTGCTGGGNPTVELTQAEYDLLVSAGTVSADTYYIITDAPAITAMTSGDVQNQIDSSISGKVETSAITTSVTSASTDSEIPTAKAVYDAIPTSTSAVTSGSTDCLTSGGAYEQFGGLKLKKVTQNEYDALVSGGTVDNNTLYVIS